MTVHSASSSVSMSTGSRHRSCCCASCAGAPRRRWSSSHLDSRMCSASATTRRQTGCELRAGMWSGCMTAGTPTTRRAGSQSGATVATGRSVPRRSTSSPRAEGAHGLQDVADIRLHQRVVGDPGVAHDASAIHHEHRPFADAVETFAVRVVTGIHDPILANNLAIEVAQQRKRQLQLRGVRGMRSIALDTQAEDLRSQLGELRVVLTERTQLATSNAAEIEDVPQQDNRAAPQAGVQRDGLAGRCRQCEARRLVANPNRWHSLMACLMERSGTKVTHSRLLYLTRLGVAKRKMATLLPLVPNTWTGECHGRNSMRERQQTVGWLVQISRYLHQRLTGRKLTGASSSRIRASGWCSLSPGWAGRSMGRTSICTDWSSDHR